MSDLSAYEALHKLMEGNKNYIQAQTNTGDYSPAIRQKNFTEGQKPYAIVVCCADSRVVPESIFMAGLGEIFVIRVAGNIIARSQLGSIEYAADHLGCHLCLVLGHTNCGAVGSALGGEVEGYTKFLTDEIKRLIGNETDPYMATCMNAMGASKLIRLYLKPEERPKDKELVILSSVYHTDTGTVEILS